MGDGIVLSLERDSLAVYAALVVQEHAPETEILVDGTIGTRFGKYVPSGLMEIALGVVFALVGLLVLGVELAA